MFRLARRLLIKNTFPGKQFLFTDFPSRASYFSHSGNTQNYSFVIVDISYLVLMACALGKMSDFDSYCNFFASQHDNYQHFYRFSRFINFHRLDGWRGWKNIRKRWMNLWWFCWLIITFFLRGKTVSSDNFPSGLFNHEMMSSRCLITTLFQFFHCAVYDRRDSQKNKPLISAIFISREWKIESLIRWKILFLAFNAPPCKASVVFYAVRHVVCVFIMKRCRRKTVSLAPLQWSFQNLNKCRADGKILSHMKQSLRFFLFVFFFPSSSLRFRWWWKRGKEGTGKRENIHITTWWIWLMRWEVIKD